MPPPSQLAIATSALNRLVKEEASYYKEYASQQERIAKLENGESADDENAEFILRQERTALEETKKLFPQLRTKIEDAKAKLAGQLQSGNDVSTEEVTKAEEAIAAAEKVTRGAI